MIHGGVDGPKIFSTFILYEIIWTFLKYVKKFQDQGEAVSAQNWHSHIVKEMQ